MTDVSIFAAIVAGVVSFLSPCVLPLVPGYLAFLSVTGAPAASEPARLRLRHVSAIPILNREKRIQSSVAPRSLAGSYSVGMAFGFGWTP